MPKGRVKSKPKIEALHDKKEGATKRQPTRYQKMNVEYSEDDDDMDSEDKAVKENNRKAKMKAKHTVV